MKSYIRTQVKILGEENEAFCDTVTIRALRMTYAVVLIFLMVGFSFYLTRL